jgi:hypothetical protein
LLLAQQAQQQPQQYGMAYGATQQAPQQVCVRCMIHVMQLQYHACEAEIMFMPVCFKGNVQNRS